MPRSAWHTLLVEIHGSEMLARLDGQVVAVGADDAIDRDKSLFGLVVRGTSVSFKNFSAREMPSRPSGPP